jgi:hypothetical protein
MGARKVPSSHILGSEQIGSTANRGYRILESARAVRRIRVTIGVLTVA